MLLSGDLAISWDTLSNNGNIISRIHTSPGLVTITTNKAELEWPVMRRRQITPAIRLTAGPFQSSALIRPASGGQELI